MKRPWYVCGGVLWRAPLMDRLWPAERDLTEKPFPCIPTHLRCRISATCVRARRKAHTPNCQRFHDDPNWHTEAWAAPR